MSEGHEMGEFRPKEEEARVAAMSDGELKKTLDVVQKEILKRKERGEEIEDSEFMKPVEPGHPPREGWVKQRNGVRVYKRHGWTDDGSGKPSYFEETTTEEHRLEQEKKEGGEAKERELFLREEAERDKKLAAAAKKFPEVKNSSNFREMERLLDQFLTLRKGNHPFSSDEFRLQEELQQKIGEIFLKDESLREVIPYYAESTEADRFDALMGIQAHLEVKYGDKMTLGLQDFMDE